MTTVTAAHVEIWNAIAAFAEAPRLSVACMRAVGRVEQALQAFVLEREPEMARAVERSAELESLLRNLLEAVVWSSADGQLIVLGDALSEYNAAARALGLPEVPDAG